MPQVPVVVENEQRLRPLNDQRFDAPDIGMGGRALGGAVQRLGQTVGQVAEREEEIRTIYAEARAKQADNAYQEFERDILFGEDGYYLKQNEAAVSARPTMEEAINKRIGELVAGAQDHRERQMLENVLNRRRQTTFDGMARYSQGQAKQFAITQSNARVENAQENYIRFFRDDPSRAAAERATLLSEVARRAELEGLHDADVIRSMREDALSGMHKGMIAAEMLDDPTKAAEYLEQHRDEIDPATQLALDSQLQPLLVERDAKGFADQIEKIMLPTTAPVQVEDAEGQPQAAADTGGVWKAMIHAESRGRQMVGGKPITSSAGAIGIAQVMPATAREMAAELGIPFDDKRYRTDAAYNEMLGRAYFSKMLRRYRGNVSYAVAAYNAGPGNVDKAIRRGGADWRSKLPAETRGYLNNVLGANQGSAGGVAVPDRTSQPSLSAQLEQAETIIRERLAGKSPRYIEQVIDQTKAELRQRSQEAQAAKREAENAEWEMALESIDAVGGNVTSISQVPNFHRLPPDRRLQIRGMIETNLGAAAGGQEIETNYSAYANYLSMSPAQLRKIGVDELRRNLGDTELKEVLKRRGGTGDPAKALTLRDIRTYTQMSLGEAGYAVGDSKEARGDASEVNQFLRTLMNWAQNVQSQTGKWPTEEAIRKQGDRLLIEGAWYEDGKRVEGRAFQRKGRGFDPDVPDDTRKTIVNALTRALGRAPTPREISEAYIAGKGIDW